MPRYRNPYVKFGILLSSEQRSGTWKGTRQFDAAVLYALANLKIHTPPPLRDDDTGRSNSVGGRAPPAAAGMVFVAVRGAVGVAVVRSEPPPPPAAARDDDPDRAAGVRPDVVRAHRRTGARCRGDVARIARHDRGDLTRRFYSPGGGNANAGGGGSSPMPISTTTTTTTTARGGKRR